MVQLIYFVRSDIIPIDANMDVSYYVCSIGKDVIRPEYSANGGSIIHVLTERDLSAKRSLLFQWGHQVLCV